MKHKVISKVRFRLALRSLCCAFVLLVVSEFAYSQGAPTQKWQADETDLRALISESKRKSDQNWEAMSGHYSAYSFKWRRVVREKDGKGKLNEESKLYEVYAPTAGCWTKKCRREVVLLEENGKLVAPERIEKERLKVGEKLEKAEREVQAPAPLPFNAPSNRNWMRFFVRYNHFAKKDIFYLLDGQEILEKCDFTLARRERIAGRELIALDFRPRAGATFGKSTRYIPQVEGRIWIDAIDKVFVRLAAWPSGKKFEDATSDHLLENAALAYDLVRTKEGLWFFRLGRINGAQYPELFPKVKKDFLIEQFDYTHFKVEVEKGQVIAPVK
jgi:hypothetical protein